MMHLVNPEQVAVEDDLRHPHTLPAEVRFSARDGTCQNVSVLIEDVLAHFHVSLETGLTGSQARQVCHAVGRKKLLSRCSNRGYGMAPMRWQRRNA